MKRGEIWTAAAQAEFAHVPRPVVIVQHQAFSALDSVTICGFTSDPTDLPLLRILIDPSPFNGLRSPSRIMADRILTIRKSKLGYRIGQLSESDVVRLNRAIVTFLGLSSSRS